MTDAVLLISTIAVPLAAALASAATKSRFVSAVGTVAWSGACVAVAYRVFAHGILSTQIGGWPAPHGITLVADRLSAIMLVVVAVVGLATACCKPDSDDVDVRLYYPLIHVLVAAVSGAVITGDLFNLYVWFELLLISSFVLLVTGRGLDRFEGAVKYAVISIVGSVFFLAGIGLTYGLIGTLNMADLAVRVAETGGPLNAVSMLFVLAFGLKAAAFPFYFWLPASYPAAAPPIAALFAGLLTKVGIYSLLRVFTLIFTHDPAFVHEILLWIAGLTMLAGVTGAIVQKSFRRMAAFLMVGTAGFMLVGLGLFTPLGLTGSIFYLLEDAVVVAALFLLAGILRARFGTDRIDRINGLSGRSALLTLLFFVPAFSLAGIPPLAGFWSKLMLTSASLESSAYVLAGVLLVASLFILIAMLRVWFGPFGRHEATPVCDDSGSHGGLLIATGALAGVTLVITLFAGTFVEIAALAADDLLHPDRYIQAVMGE